MSAARPPEGLPVLDQEALESLPGMIRAGIERLESSGRCLLDDISAAAPQVSQGATTPPFGLCHREFHPSSLHIGTTKTALLDWQRAFVGPLLLKFANWFDIGAPPDLAACRSLIDAYGAGSTGASRYVGARRLVFLLAAHRGGRVVGRLPRYVGDGPSTGYSVAVGRRKDGPRRPRPSAIRAKSARREQQWPAVR